MSSWKKSSKTNQKTHRERHQPEARSHLGLLEKKKDYKRRADDQHEKDDTLKLLRKRALDKNPDEFYHHMINSKINDGEHFEKEKKEEHTPEQMALMETQDLRYITMKRVMETKKIQKLQSQLHMIDSVNNVKNQHTFFVDDEDEAKQFQLAKRLDTHPSLLGRRTNRHRLSKLGDLQLPDVDKITLKMLQADRDKAYKEQSRRVEREKQLSIVQTKLSIKRALKEKRELKPILKETATKHRAAIYEFPYERKK